MLKGWALYELYLSMFILERVDIIVIISIYIYLRKGGIHGCIADNLKSWFSAAFHPFSPSCFSLLCPFNLSDCQFYCVS